MSKFEEMKRDAEQGDATAQYRLGVMYGNGQRLPRITNKP